MNDERKAIERNARAVLAEIISRRQEGEGASIDEIGGGCRAIRLTSARGQGRYVLVTAHDEPSPAPVDPVDPWAVCLYSDEGETLVRQTTPRGLTFSGIARDALTLLRHWQPPRVAPAADETRLHEAHAQASHAFWAAIGHAYPELESGDVTPDAAQRWDAFTKEQIRAHLIDNAPPRPMLTDAQAERLREVTTYRDPEGTISDSVNVYTADADDCSRAGISYPDGRVVRFDIGAHAPGEIDGYRTFVMIVDGEGEVCDNYER